MNADLLAEMYVAGIVREDKAACKACFNSHLHRWQEKYSLGPADCQLLELVFSIGWAERACWAGERFNPVAEMTP